MKKYSKLHILSTIFDDICGKICYDHNMEIKSILEKFGLSGIETKIATAEWNSSCLPTNLQPICYGLFEINLDKRWNTEKILQYLSSIGF